MFAWNRKAQGQSQLLYLAEGLISLCSTGDGETVKGNWYMSCLVFTYGDPSCIR